VKPVIHGGGQENGLRSGTQNTAAIAGFGLAVQKTMAFMPDTTERMHALRKKLADGLSAIPGARVITSENPAPHIVSVAFPGLRSEILLHALESRGIYVSSGSACSSNRPHLSPTLLALGFDRKVIDSAIRFSLGIHTTEADIAEAISCVSEQTALLSGV